MVVHAIRQIIKVAGTTGSQGGPSVRWRRNMPKEKGKVRTLQIPCIRDRVAQGAVESILKAIFLRQFGHSSLLHKPFISR